MPIKSNDSANNMQKIRNQTAKNTPNSLSIEQSNTLVCYSIKMDSKSSLGNCRKIVGLFPENCRK